MITVMFAGFVAWCGTLSWSPTPMIPLQTHNWPHQTRLRSHMTCQVVSCQVMALWIAWIALCRAQSLGQAKVWAQSHWCTCDHSGNLRGQVPGLKKTRCLPICQVSCQLVKYLSCAVIQFYKHPASFFCMQTTNSRYILLSQTVIDLPVKCRCQLQSQM